MRIIVTGAASGIGEALARLLAAEGPDGAPARMLLVDRDAARLEELAGALGASSLAADVGDPGCGEAIVAAALGALGGIDAVVSNAGIIQQSPLAELETEDWDRIFAINTRATWLLARAAYPHLRAAGGAIVATGSISASHPTPPLGAYAASKAALVMLVRQLANEWGRDGIRCNCVSPGPTMTGITKAGYSNQDLRRQREASLPLGRIGGPDDIADAIAFLLSPKARNITGIDLLVDGGLGTTLMTGSGAGSGHKGNAS
jgi:NAD(P)-dependent dehydrogenase (short-subunit alcohol dehydrogenase family)